MTTKSLHATYFPGPHKGRKQRVDHHQHVDPYPLLGILLLVLTAVLTYGASYFLLFA